MAERIPWTKDFCFHPDIADAYHDYVAGDKMAFRRAIQAHQEAAKQGERIISGTEVTDQVLIDMVQQRTYRYVLTTGDQRPTVKMSEKKRRPKKHWTDIVLGAGDDDGEM